MWYLVHWQNYEHVNWFYEQYMEMETAYLSVHVSVNFALVDFLYKQQKPCNLNGSECHWLKGYRICDKRL